MCQRFGAVFGLIALLVITSVASSADEQFEIFPVGRYVLKTNRFHKFPDYVEAIVDGSATYDDVFRHPYLPLGSIYVDCKKTHRIGVTLGVNPIPDGKSLLRRFPDSISKKMRVLYRWSHSALSIKGGRYEWYERPGQYKPYTGIISSGLTLTKRDRIDGTFSVEIVYEKNVVYQTSFVLVACGK